METTTKTKKGITMDERVEQLKENLDVVSENSKEAIKEIIRSCTKQAGDAVEINKRMIDVIKENLKKNGIDTSIIDALYDSFGTAVELSEKVIDTIIDAHNNRIDLTVDFQKKFLETIKVQSLTNKTDFGYMVDLLQENFEESVTLSNRNMRGIIDMYNSHVNLTLNFNRKFDKSINTQIKIMTDLYKKSFKTYGDLVSKWWENVEESRQ